jgi:hypothetical protein
MCNGANPTPPKGGVYRLGHEHEQEQEQGDIKICVQ